MRPEQSDRTPRDPIQYEVSVKQVQPIASGSRRAAARAAIVVAIAVSLQIFALATRADAASSVFLDAPRPGAVVTSYFHVGGWAIDWASSNGTGIETVHVWAYPANGAPPVFLGVPSTGARPDVAAAFGANFIGCGFGLNVQGLAPGSYMLAIFPYSQALNGFDFASAISVNIRVVASSQSVAPTTDKAPAASAQGGVRLRVLQWNLHHGVGTDGKYDIDRIATWIARMDPDVVTLNEVEKNTYWGREDQPARYEAMLQAKTGKRWYAVFAQEFGDWTSNGKGHLILSTYPIESSDRVAISYDRVIDEARITVNGRTVSLIVTHLDPESATRRLTQAQQVTRWAAAVPENRILTGDMNAWPDQTSIHELNGEYRDSWTDATARGAASSFSGLTPDGATKKGRIDYIFYSRGAANLAVVSSKVYDTRDGSGVMPSDHRPVLTTFEVR